MTKNELHPERKNHLIAYLMWGLGFVGISGMHRLYLGQYGRGVALILTFALQHCSQLLTPHMIWVALQRIAGWSCNWIMLPHPVILHAFLVFS